LDLEGSGYSGLVLEKLNTANVKVGDTIMTICNGQKYIGILMPRAQIGTDPNHLVIKLDSGYNIGIHLKLDSKIQKISSPKKLKHSTDKESPKEKDDLPIVAILSTGGTIASRIDYKTGAVNPALTAQDLYDAVPELKDHANIRARVLMSLLSENITASDWTKIARAVALEIKNGADGVVIAHGTDTMGYTAAALSFALQNLPVPVALVGSQRSSDRPSSDAALNLIGATDLVSRADAAEVMVVMHGKTDDAFLYAHRGTRVRKAHSSRRDAFQSINSSPLFKIDSSKIIELSAPILHRDTKRKLKLKPKFDDRVALMKIYPSMKPETIDTLREHQYRGIIIEGSGLGHAPDILDQAIQRAIDEDIIIGMTSQCIWGRVDMNVYRTGVKLLEMGVIACEDMLAETALVKLMWLLANIKNTEEIREKLAQSLLGEIEFRTELSEYPPHTGVE
jgi:glutamyl-tRNA(Gln) amidotransferase subunit D